MVNLWMYFFFGQHVNTLGIYCSQTCCCSLAIGKESKKRFNSYLFQTVNKKHQLRDVTFRHSPEGRPLKFSELKMPLLRLWIESHPQNTGNKWF